MDAFYLYSKSPRKHLTNLTVWINSQPIDAYLRQIKQKIPVYREDHTYTFVMNAPKGILTFGVGDGLSVNKGGSFTVTVTPGTG